MRLTVSQKLARKLKQAFDAEGHGSQARFVAFSRTRPGGTSVSAQSLSYFLHGHRQNPIALDDLADLAAYFRVSVSELLDDRVSLSSGGVQRRSGKTIA